MNDNDPKLTIAVACSLAALIIANYAAWYSPVHKHHHENPMSIVEIDSIDQSGMVTREAWVMIKDSHGKALGPGWVKWEHIRNVKIGLEDVDPINDALDHDTIMRTTPTITVGAEPLTDKQMNAYEGKIRAHGLGLFIDLSKEAKAFTPSTASKLATLSTFGPLPPHTDWPAVFLWTCYTLYFLWAFVGLIKIFNAPVMEELP